MSASARPKPSTSNLSAISNARSHGKRYTKKDLIQRLQILGPITNPLPATLPPSPPASRSPSPAPSRSLSNKRKIEDVDNGNSTTSSSGSKRSRSSPQAPLTPPGDEPLQEPHREASPFPIKRPRKGRKPEGGGYGPVHNKYMEYGRLFKRSSDARNNVYNRPESVQFCQLLNRPALGSSYAKHDRMMSKFEALESVLCFAYGQWYKELYSNQHDILWWQNSASFFDVSKRTHMEAFQNPGPREEALHGIHFLVEAYWRSRYAWHYFRYYVDNKVSSLLVEHQKSPATTTKSSPGSDAGVRGTSVALSTQNNSNSTNGSHHHHSNVTLQPTPPSTGLSPATHHQALTSGSVGHSATSHSPVVPPVPGSGGGNSNGHHQRAVQFPEDLAKQIQNATKLHLQAGDALLYASQRLTLQVLASHFPRTFARVTKTTLKSSEEYEIDFEDDESELFWPIGPTRGEGLGWVLAVGRSMLKEYAQDFGYKGIDGVCKPEDIVYPNKK